VVPRDKKRKVRMVRMVRKERGKSGKEGRERTGAKEEEAEARSGSHAHNRGQKKERTERNFPEVGPDESARRSRRRSRGHRKKRPGIARVPGEILRSRRSAESSGGLAPSLPLAPPAPSRDR
jgi:hypothetical protein